MSLDNIEKSIQEKILTLEKKAELLNRVVNKNQQEEVLQLLADKMSLLCVTEEHLESQYIENMKAFKEFDYNVYQFYSNFQTSKYSIEIKDGFANIFNLSEKRYEYNYPGYLMSLAQVIDYQKNPQSTNSAFEYNNDNHYDFIHSKYLNKIISLLDEQVKIDENKRSTLPRDISSFMLFGVGLGYHIELMVYQHQINNLYIFEPDEELFYCSLYTTNWVGILKHLNQKNSTLHLSIGVTGNEFFDDLLQKTYENGRHDSVKTYGYMHNNKPAIREQVALYKERFREFVQGWGFFDDGILAIAHTFNNLENNVGILNKSAENNLINSNIPVFIIGNGPSLDSTIEFIRKYKERAIIISCGSALSALIRYGIKADYHCEQERTYPVAEKVGLYGTPEEVAEPILLAPSTVHPKVFKFFHRAIMCAKAREPSSDLLMADESLKDQIEPLSFVNPTVANTAVSMAHALGYREFYLFGVDLGRKEGGNHHSSNSLYYDDNGEDLSLYIVDDNKNRVKGNFGGEFICDDFFYMSRRSIEKLLKAYQSIKCFNLSDGVKITGAVPTKTIDFSERLLINKLEHLNNTYKTATIKCSMPKIVNNYYENSGSESFSELCRILLEVTSKDVLSIRDGLDLLKEQTNQLIKSSTGNNNYIFSLLHGTLLHYQSMLVRILYYPKDENIAISDFNKGKEFLNQFLSEAPKLYYDNYNVSRESDIVWWIG